MTGSPLILDVSPRVAGHLAVALRQHQEWAARSGMALPQELAQLQAALTTRATRGQDGTPLEDLWSVRHGQDMAPRLVTYANAARLLSVHERTVKRLVASGDLPVVRIGGAARIRTADLDDYIAHLAASTAHEGASA